MPTGCLKSSDLVIFAFIYYVKNLNSKGIITKTYLKIRQLHQKNFRIKKRHKKGKAVCTALPELRLKKIFINA